MRTAFTIFCIGFLNLCYSQDFETFFSYKKNILKEMLESEPDLCDLNTGHWVNSSSADPNSEHYGKFTIVHFGSFDNHISLRDIQALSRLQKDFPFIRVIFSLNPKFDYPRNDDDILFELEKRQIPLPVFVDDGFALWQCMNINYWPTTLFIGPNGNVISRHVGALNMDDFRESLPLILERLGSLLERNPEPFYGMPPGRWNKRAVLEFPVGLTTIPKEKIIFVSDFLGNRILGLTNRGDVIYCIGSGEKGMANGDMDQATFNGPWGLAYNEDNHVLYIADSKNHMIRKVDLRSETVTTLMGTGKIGPPGRGKILGTNSPINYPTGLLYKENDLFISMTGNSEIWKMDIRTEVAERIAGSGAFGFQDGEALNSRLAAPAGLTLDPSNSLFFSDAQASALRYLSNESVATAVGEGIFGYGFSDGRREDILMQFPHGIESYDEKIYVADTYNHSLRVIEPFKNRSETLAGDPAYPGYRNGFEPLLRLPMDVVELDNILYIADAGNGALRSYNLETGEMSGVPLYNYVCVGRGELLGLTDLRDGPELVFGDGLNEVQYELDLGENYEIDTTAFSDAGLVSRHPGFELVDTDLSDGKIAFTFMPDTNARRPAATMEFSIFFRNVDEPARQFHKKISFYHQVEIDPEAPFRHEVVVPYDPDRGRK